VKSHPVADMGQSRCNCSDDKSVAVIQDMTLRAATRAHPGTAAPYEAPYNAKFVVSVVI